jgi:uncharacterized peroxidase-related enzyme
LPLALARTAMSEPAMTRFEVPDIEELPESVRDRIEYEEERAGFRPNFLSAMAYRPRQFEAFFEYHDAIVEDSGLKREEIEMIIVAVSGANDCLYCVVAHGALLRIYASDPLLAEQLATNYRTANINETHRTMCEVAVKLTEEPDAVTEADLDKLRDVGFSDGEIWDIASLTALFNLSNRLASFADIRPNEEFYTLGRDQDE